MKKPELLVDEFDQELLKQVFPADWKNPSPAATYDLIVVGGGPGGMTAAALASGYHKKIALIEKQHMGGECLNVGCIPSKAMLRSSKLAGDIRDAKDFGIDIPEGWSVNFPAVMERVRRLRSKISALDSPKNFQKMGIDVFFGRGNFTGPDTLEVGGQKLRFKKAIIATGTDPLVLDIPGLEDAGYLTNQTVFNLTVLPKRLAILGAGPIGCELSQAFLRFGSQVTMITHGPRILSREDSVASERLQKVLEKEGVRFLFSSKVKKIEKRGKEKIFYFEGSSDGLAVDEILVAVGRIANVEGFGLEKANVVADRKNGIAANDFLQTSNPNIYLVGDMNYKFTHVSVEQAHIAVGNALGKGNAKRSSLVISWCTFTDPEIAHVGINEKEAQIQGISLQTLQYEMKDSLRGILDGETSGFFKLHVKEGTDQILGATLMARHAGEMISEVTVAITGKVGLLGLTRTIHPFPTQSEVIKAAGENLLKKMTASKRNIA